MLTLQQFVKIAINTKTSEKDKCKRWLYKQIRMQLNNDSVDVRKNWKIHLAHTEVSLIPSDNHEGTGHLNCHHKIAKAIYDIRGCEDFLLHEIKRIEPNCNIDLKRLLSDIEQNLINNSKGIMAPSTSMSLLENSWSKYLQEKLDKSFQETEHINIEELDIDHISQDLRRGPDPHPQLFARLIAEDNSIEQISNILKEYKFKDEDFPQEDDIYSRCLGKYSPREEKITIYLNTIYDIATIKGIDPVILFRKVLIHEMAHCLHHVGIDGDDKIWDDFGYQTYGKYTIEGLAQWYTYRYMYHFDKESKNKVPVNLLTMLWFSNFQPDPYNHFKTWHKYNYENMNRVLIEARKNQNLKESIGTAFDKELKDNHVNKTV